MKHTRPNVDWHLSFCHLPEGDKPRLLELHIDEIEALCTYIKELENLLDVGQLHGEHFDSCPKYYLEKDDCNCWIAESRALLNQIPKETNNGMA